MRCDAFTRKCSDRLSSVTPSRRLRIAASFVSCSSCGIVCLADREEDEEDDEEDDEDEEEEESDIGLVRRSLAMWTLSFVVRDILCGLCVCVYVSGNKGYYDRNTKKHAMLILLYIALLLLHAFTFQFLSLHLFVTFYPFLRLRAQVDTEIVKNDVQQNRQEDFWCQDHEKASQSSDADIRCNDCLIAIFNESPEELFPALGTTAERLQSFVSEDARIVYCFKEVRI